MRFHASVFWSKEQDWSGWQEADTPGEALDKLIASVRSKLTPEELREMDNAPHGVSCTVDWRKR